MIDKVPDNNEKNKKDWLIEGNRLAKTFYFENFPRAVVFVNRCIDPIEEKGHYPEIKLTYDRVKIKLFTHEQGKITSKDYDLAKAIDELL